ncbi:MAG TPA: DUF4864 domain-containing protein [Candidatus Polarisedimenticolia bacterium]|jgi:hypothetical protein|nr:DUF4864 domain-containing protein [Dongiaceae bacterium]HYV88528.1 DUF4864 domain-containing protein [Candidatus Polarisedimenticolia bacterium]
MARCLLTFLTFVLLLLPVAARAGDPAVSPADTAAIRAVITDQLGAFRRDDGATAYADASPTIQTLFHDADTFMQMVRTGYQSVYRASGVEFRDLGMVGDRLIQQVYMTGPDGIPVLALYQMQKQPDGSWKINGCSIAKAPDQGV